MVQFHQCHYADAVDTLQDLRQDLVALSPDVQFSFREQVEPVYRQFVQLLLADVLMLQHWLVRIPLLVLVRLMVSQMKR